MNKKDIAYQIGAFMEKYHNDTKKVELPAWEFKVKCVFSVKVAEESLKEKTNLWTFEATAQIQKTDDRETVSTIEKVKLIGNATVTAYISKETKEQLPQVEFVEITKIADSNK